MWTYVVAVANSCCAARAASTHHQPHAGARASSSSSRAQASKLAAVNCAHQHLGGGGEGAKGLALGGVEHGDEGGGGKGHHSQEHACREGGREACGGGQQAVRRIDRQGRRTALGTVQESEGPSRCSTSRHLQRT